MRILRILGKFLKTYLIVIGLLAHVALAGAVLYGLSQSQLTIRQLLVKAAQKGGVASPTVVEWIAPPARFTDFTLDGRLRTTHPAGGILGTTACWLTYGEAAQAEPLLKAARAFHLEPPTVNGYGNSWMLAFAYDFLRLYADLPAADRVQLEVRIESALQETLRVLDESSASLWHGRSSLAAIAWLNAVVLDPGDSTERQQLIARAQGHFLETIKALALTEGWPEGYNYWIQERAFLIALAGSAYLNGLQDSRQADLVRKALRRVGYWTIYATRPDQRIEGLGDEGSRVDLKDETRRVIDLIAQATRDPVLAGYSLYLERLHGRESYYREYRWGFNLFNDSTVAPIGGGALAGFNGLLPSAELFGADSFNLAYIRSDWSPDATFISFRAGDTFTHHGHYDAGHFSLFKGAPLAINSSSSGDYFGRNRLNYAIRGVAKNTLLILRPGEKVQPNRFFNDNVADGGPRIILPTGSAINNIQDWLENRSKGLYLEGGRLERFEHQEGAYTYLAADLTAAYNTPEHDEGGWGGKVEQAQRQLLYLADEDRLLIRDRVRTVKPDFVKKWLLHTVERPEVADLRALKGRLDNGILESASDVAQVQNGRGWLTVQRILPEDAVMRLVGGRDYQYYVEADGDETQLDGINFVEGASLSPWFDIGLWRLEIQPGGSRQDDTFLVVLTPALHAPRLNRAARVALDQAGSGVVTDASATVFVDTPVGDELRLTIPNATRIVRIIGLPPLAHATLQSEKGPAAPVESAASASGVTVFKTTTNWQGRLILHWR